MGDEEPPAEGQASTTMRGDEEPPAEGQASVIMPSNEEPPAEGQASTTIPCDEEPPAEGQASVTMLGYQHSIREELPSEDWLECAINHDLEEWIANSATQATPTPRLSVFESFAPSLASTAVNDDPAGLVPMCDDNPPLSSEPCDHRPHKSVLRAEPPDSSPCHCELPAVQPVPSPATPKRKKWLVDSNDTLEYDTDDSFDEPVDPAQSRYSRCEFTDRLLSWDEHDVQLIISARGLHEMQQRLQADLHDVYGPHLPTHKVAVQYWHVAQNGARRVLKWWRQRERYREWNKYRTAKLAQGSSSGQRPDEDDSSGTAPTTGILPTPAPQGRPPPVLSIPEILSAASELVDTMT
eukprot:358261-Rhodomonas_salina.1